MPGILTRRIGPFPGWVWGLAAGGGFLLFMYMRRRGQAAQGQVAPVAIPQFASASGTIPFVPSASVTGQPQPANAPQGPLPGQSTTNPQASMLPPAALWQFGSGYVGKQTVWRATQVGQQNFQASTGGSWPGGIFPGLPDDGTQTALGRYGWQWAQVPSGWDPNTYATALNQSTQGSGGYGYAGTPGLATPVGGWTVGWQPWGSGGPSTVNRTGAARSRRLYGGSGGGQAAVNRTGARATRPLRRRALSGR